MPPPPVYLVPESLFFNVKFCLCWELLVSMESLGETMCREKGLKNEGKRRIVGDKTMTKKGVMENELRYYYKKSSTQGLD